MADDFTVQGRVTVKEDSSVAKSSASIRDLTKNTQRASNATESLADHSKKMNRVQGQAVAGISNTTRSFSKMAASLGNDRSGIVGAYATLAGNVFAVSAAFNALRSASQADQMLRGLEAAGVRTGQSLTNTARALKDVTGAAISSEEAMRATAQITSAGFGSDAVRRLGQAARDTSFALGRSMTDSLERLSRGIVKLEPELLDELGIMTKITESNRLYAQSLGKTESQLTNTEKRVGFMNAVLAEAELKFGGIAQAAGGASAFDKMAATFNDLTKAVLGFVNVIVQPILGAFSNSMLATAGAALLFLTTLKNQLIPGLNRVAEVSEGTAKKLQAQAEAQQRNIEVARAAARAQTQSALAQAAAFDNLGDRAPKAYKKIRAEILDTSKTAEQVEASVQKGIQSLERSNRAHRDQIKHDKVGRYADGSQGLADKEAAIAANNAEIAAIRNLQVERAKYVAADVEHEKGVAEARKVSARANLEAARASANANVMMAASHGTLGETLRAIREGQVNYRNALDEVTSAQGYQANSIKAKLAPALNTGRASMMAFGLAARAAGIMMLNAIPVIGQVIMVLGLLKAGWDALKSDAAKKQKEALEALNETTGKAVQIGNELARIQHSQAPLALRTAQAMTVQSNAVREASEKYLEYVQATDRAANSGFVDSLRKAFKSITENAKDESNKVAGYWDAALSKLNSKERISYELDIRMNSKVLDIGQSVTPSSVGSSQEIQTALRQLNALNEAAPERMDEFVRTHAGSWENLAQSIGNGTISLKAFTLQATNSINGSVAQLAQLVSELQEAFKVLDTANQEFFRSAAISTPYDNMVKGLNNVNTAIMRLQAAAGSTSTEWKNLLTGIDSSNLSVGLSREIDNLREADATVQRITALEAQRKQYMQERNIVGEALSNNERNQLYAAQNNLRLAQETGSAVQEELLAREELVQRAQQQARLGQAALTLIQAQQKATSELYAAGGAGRALQIEHENRTRDIQKAQLQIQMSILRSQFALNQEKVRSIQLEIENNEKLLQTHAQMEEMSRIGILGQLGFSGITEDHLRRMKSLNLSGDQAGPGVVGRALTPQEVGYINAYLESEQRIEASTRRRAELNISLRQQMLATRDLQASMQALSTQIAAIDADRLTTAQQRASIAKAEFDLIKQSLEALQQQQSTLNSISQIHRETTQLIAGNSDQIDSQLLNIRARANEERTAAEQGFVLRKREHELALRNARALAGNPNVKGAEREAANALIQSAERQLEINERGHAITLQEINARERLESLSKVIFNTNKEGLDWQREALELVQKRLQAEGQLLETAQEQARANSELRARRRGYEVSSMETQALEIRAAQEALNAAIRERNIKKALIDLEFTLLAAQRDNLVLELQVRRSELASRNQGGEHNTAIQQLDTTLANMPSAQLFMEAAQLQKQNIDRQEDLLRTQLQIARTPNNTGGMQIRGSLQAFTDFIQARNQQDQARPILVDRVTPGQEISPNSTPLASNREQIVSSNTESLQELTRAVQEQTRLLESRVGVLATALEQTVEAPSGSTAAGGTLNTSGVAGVVADELKRQLPQLQPHHIAAILGNLQQESGMRPGVVNSIGASGLAQWLGSRKADFRRMFGVNPNEADPRTQARFIAHELRTSESRALRRLLAENTLEGSTVSFRKNYERPGEHEANDRRRISAARGYYSLSSSNAPVQQAVQEPVPAATVQQIRQPVVDTISTSIGEGIRAEIPKVVNSVLNLIEIDSDKVANQLLGNRSDSTSNEDIVVTGSLQREIAPTRNNMEEIRALIMAGQTVTQPFIEQLQQLGPGGELVAGVAQGMARIGTSVTFAIDSLKQADETYRRTVEGGRLLFEQGLIDQATFDENLGGARFERMASKIAAVADVASQTISVIQQALAASSDAKIAAVDREIDAEKKRDGKSAESVAKIQAMEKRKDEIARKAFNTNKKLMMAQAVMSTAAAVAQTLAQVPTPFNIPLAAAIGALGAAQIAIIAGTSYQSASSANTAQKATPPSLTIGKRGDSIDLAKRNVNVGGEIGYLRGTPGRGSNSSNYMVIGSAYGGPIPRGYGNVGYRVGEKGPEPILPQVPVRVQSSDSQKVPAPVNATFQIQALDSRGVEQLLQAQKGNIISMIREAANSTGEGFLENVDTSVYTRPNVEKL